MLEIGRIEEAITWLGSLAEAGDADALELTAWLLHEVGLTEEAITWLQSRAEAGDTYDPRQAVRLLKEAGRAEEAITWLHSRAEVGDTDALRRRPNCCRRRDEPRRPSPGYSRAPKPATPTPCS